MLEVESFNNEKIIYSSEEEKCLLFKLTWKKVICFIFKLISLEKNLNSLMVCRICEQTIDARDSQEHSVLCLNKMKYK
jgi:hypothetical protein